MGGGAYAWPRHWPGQRSTPCLPLLLLCPRPGARVMRRTRHAVEAPAAQHAAPVLVNPGLGAGCPLGRPGRGGIAGACGQRAVSVSGLPGHGAWGRAQALVVKAANGCGLTPHRSRWPTAHTARAMGLPACAGEGVAVVLPGPLLLLLFLLYLYLFLLFVLPIPTAAPPPCCHPAACGVLWWHLPPRHRRRPRGHTRRGGPAAPRGGLRPEAAVGIHSGPRPLQAGVSPRIRCVHVTHIVVYSIQRLGEGRGHMEAGGERAAAAS